MIWKINFKNLKIIKIQKKDTNNIQKTDSNTSTIENTENTNSSTRVIINSDTQNMIVGNSTSSIGENQNDNRAYELNETHSVSKQINQDYTYFLLFFAIAIILFAIGYRKNLKRE